MLFDARELSLRKPEAIRCWVGGLPQCLYSCVVREGIEMPPVTWSEKHGH